MVDATNERVVKNPAEERASAGWLGFCKPSVLGGFGLALALVLWGYNYRLSLYQPHRDTASRTLAPKLWIDQRHASEEVAARIGAETQQHAPTDVPDLHPPLPFEWMCVCALVAPPTHIRRARFFRSLLPLRSPPSSSFSA